MSVDTVSNLIETYNPMINIASETPPFSDVSKLLKEFANKVRSLGGIEDELLSYFKNNLNTKEWTDYDLWCIAAIEHPSEQYIEYLLRALEEQECEFHNWRTLDVLAHMPETVSKIAIPKLVQLIESNSPIWSEDIIDKAFETLVWIGSDIGISFISKACDSSNKVVSEAAKYWNERLSENS